MIEASSWLLGNQLCRLVHQVSRQYLENTSKPHNGQEGGAFDAALQFRDEGPFNLCLPGQLFLGQSSIQTIAPQDRAEGNIGGSIPMEVALWFRFTGFPRLWHDQKLSAALATVLRAIAHKDVYWSHYQPVYLQYPTTRPCNQVSAL